MTNSNTILRRGAALLLALAFALTAALPVFAEGAASSDTFYIDSVSQLLELAEKCSVDSWSRGKTVVLRQDLSLEGFDWEPIPSFSGTFEGGGHTLRNLQLTGSYSPAGLFAIVEEGAVIENLNVQGFAAPSGDNDTAGGIVGVNNGTLINCQFSGAVKGGSEVGGLVGRNEERGTLARCTSRTFLDGKSSTGGVVGYNLGSISSCTNVGEVNTEYQNTTLNMDGFSAELMSMIEQYVGQSSGTVSSNAPTDSGGIAGRSSGLILSCTNTGTIGYAHLGYNVGGIVGRNDGMVSGCINQGKVQGRKDVGGIVGQAEPYRELDLSQSTIEKLRTELDKLHDVVNGATDEIDNTSDIFHTNFDGLNSQLDTAIDAARQLKDQGSDYADTVADEIDRTGVLVSDTFSKLEPVLETGEEAIDQMASGMDELKWATQELSYEIALGSDALKKVEDAGDDVSDAMDIAQKALEEIADGFEDLRDAYEAGDDDAAETAMQSIFTAYDKLPATYSDSTLDRAVSWLKLANTVVGAVSLTRSLSPQMQAVSAGVNLLQGAALVSGNTDLQRGMTQITKALSGISGINRQLGALAHKASTMASDDDSQLGDALDNIGDALDGIGDDVSDLEDILTDLGFNIDGLHSGADAIQDGIDKLSQSADKLQSASESMQDAISELKTDGYLVSATTERVSSSIGSIEDGTKTLGDMLSQTKDIVSWLSDQDPVHVPRPDSALSDTADTLFDAMDGISAQMNSLNENMKSASTRLTNQMRAINDQVNVVLDLLLDAIEEISDPEDKTILDDTSETAPSTTDGRIENCTNRGVIDADVDVGGITGAMAVENLLDPEDDQLEESKSLLRTGYSVSAVVVGCTNEGAVTAKKKAVGGIVGRMDLGLIQNCEAYGDVTGGNQVGGIAGASSAKIKSSWAKCTLSGGNYVGGILGEGTESSYTSASSTVQNCRALVDIDEADQFSGAISGGQSGTFSGNLFVSDNLRGIDRLSRAGQAEPISYASMMELENVPTGFKQLVVTFKDEDHVLGKVRVDYGASLTEADYPDLPSKEGNYSQWSSPSLESLHLDTVVSVVYTPYVQALRSAAMRDGGRPVFFAEGDFTDTDVLAAVQSPIESGTPSGTVEQWSLTLPSDGADDHIVRYLPEDTDKTYKVYLKDNGSWHPLETDSMGSYLTFTVSGADAEIAVVKAGQPIWVFILIGAAVVLVLLLLLKRKRGKKKPPKTQKPEADEELETPIETEPET